MQNFPFEYNGKEYWYSRSLACAVLVFANDKDGNLCVLASKRGKGCEFLPGQWNISGGFIDFNENAADCAARECYEETGIKLEPNKLKFYDLNTEPNGVRQTMVARYHCFLTDLAEDIKTTNEFSEPDEVEEIRWFKCNNDEDIDKMSTDYVWTRDQIKYIRKISKIYIDNNERH